MDMNGYSHRALETGMQLMKKSVIIPKPTLCRQSGTSPMGWCAAQLFTSGLRFQRQLIFQVSLATGRESKGKSYKEVFDFRHHLVL